MKKAVVPNNRDTITKSAELARKVCTARLYGPAGSKDVWYVSVTLAPLLAPVPWRLESGFAAWCSDASLLVYSGVGFWLCSGWRIDRCAC